MADQDFIRKQVEELSNKIAVAQEEIIDGINKKVNLPLVSEAKEEKIFTSLFDAMLEVLEKVLNKKK